MGQLLNISNFGVALNLRNFSLIVLDAAASPLNCSSSFVHSRNYFRPHGESSVLQGSPR